MLVKNLIGLVLLFGTSFLGCAQDRNSEMTVAELKKEMKNDPSLVILDVRTPGELESPLGKIEGVVNIPVQVLESRIGELNNYKGKKIAIICRSGNRSGAAIEILKKHGIQSRNVKGGMLEYWASEKQ